MPRWVDDAGAFERIITPPTADSSFSVCRVPLAREGNVCSLYSFLPSPRNFVRSLVVQLRQLEERLLDTISAVEGTILDDDTVVQALEDLKAEAGDVAKEVSRSARSIRTVFFFRPCGHVEDLFWILPHPAVETFLHACVSVWAIHAIFRYVGRGYMPLAPGPSRYDNVSMTCGASGAQTFGNAHSDFNPYLTVRCVYANPFHRCISYGILDDDTSAVSLHDDLNRDRRR